MIYTARDADGDTATLRFTITVRSSGASAGSRRYSVNDVITTLPTGFWTPDVTSGGSFQYSAGTATVRLNNGGYIEEGDYRYTCESAGGCEVVNRTVTVGVVVQTSRGGGQPLPVADDHGDTRSAATSLTLGTPVAGRIDPGDDADYFRLRLDQSTAVAIYTTGSLDTTGRLQDSSGNEVDSDDDSGAGTNFRIEATLSAGTHYIAVESSSSSQAVRTQPVTRPAFEASAPTGYTAVTLATGGRVWGRPLRYTNDSDAGTVAYMLLGTLKGCDFANAEADRRSKVYVRTQSLGSLTGYDSRTVCRKTSSRWTSSWPGVRITHLLFFDESSPTNTREASYNETSEDYSIDTSTPSSPQRTGNYTLHAEERRAEPVDLVVVSPTVSDSSPDTGERFTLRVTVRNQGGDRSAATTLRYYRSSNATISTSDVQVGTDPVGALAASGSSAESISLAAPSSPGTYYYGACVEDVSGEADSGNNCSSGVQVTVRQGGGTGPAPPSGTQYTPLEGWTVSRGRVQFLFFSAGRCVLLSNTTINGVTYTIHSSKWQRRANADSAWEDIPGTEATGRVCSYTPSASGQYRGVAEITIGGRRGNYATNNILSGP